MMVLWHLHNRDAPKFVQQCVHCNREILSGKRYHCPNCPDYDLCEACYSDPNTNRGACTHKLQAIAVESSDQEGGPTSGLTEAQRKQRQRNLLLHIQLIEHASKCTSATCKSSNCVKMKDYLKHAKSCKVRCPILDYLILRLHCSQKLALYCRQRSKVAAAFARGYGRYFVFMHRNVRNRIAPSPNVRVSVKRCVNFRSNSKQWTIVAVWK